MLRLFDKQVQLRMGQANVHRWVPDILPVLSDEDPPRPGVTLEVVLGVTGGSPIT